MNAQALEFLRNFGCLRDSIYGIPTWYKYLPSRIDAGTCTIDLPTGAQSLQQSTMSLLGIGLAIVEILLFFAGLIAVGYVMYGGFRYITSQGEPENTKIAKESIMNAIIGLLIAISATAIVRFVGRTITG